MSALRTLASQTAIYGLSSIVARFVNYSIGNSVYMRGIPHSNIP